jgi:hypothetical protein
MLLVVSALALASACTSTRVLQPTSPSPLEATGTKILLMPLDVELLELSAGGVMSPRADWTQSARAHLQKSIVARIERARAIHVVAEPSLLAENSPHLQLFKLHETIGAAIYEYQAGGPNGQLPVLPTLKTGFDWTLGESVRPLGEETGATHALFVFVRDSYATAGRKAAAVGAVLIGALTGMYMPVGTGVRIAFASLVDLRSGDVVWFNRLYSETGDLREAEPAAKATEGLLKDFPL